MGVANFAFLDPTPTFAQKTTGPKSIKSSVQLMQNWDRIL